MPHTGATPIPDTIGTVRDGRTCKVATCRYCGERIVLVRGNWQHFDSCEAQCP